MSLLDILLALPSQGVDPVSIVAQAALDTETAEGMTVLEKILIGGCGALSTTVVALFRWGNKIRSDNAAVHEKSASEFNKLLTSQTADNKDVVYALKDVGGDLERILTAVDGGDQKTALRSLERKLDDLAASLNRVSAETHDLHVWHSKTDSDDVLRWYTPKNLSEVVRLIPQMAERLARLEASINVLRRD